MHDELPEEQDAQLQSLPELVDDPNEFAQLIKLYLTHQDLASGSSDDGDELLYLFSHVTIPSGCSTNTQSVLSLITQVFKPGMGKHKVQHPLIP